MTEDLFPATAEPPPPWHNLPEQIAAIDRPAGGFPLVLIDNPWDIGMRSERGYAKSPQAHYSCVPTAVLLKLPIWKLAATDAILLMWGTWPMLLEQLDCMRAYGFTYKSAAPWFKGSPLSTGEDSEAEGWKAAFGTGYLFRSCSEVLLIGTRGEPTFLPARRSVRGAFFDPQREHSRKPDAQYTHAEALSPGPYLEIFSRTDRPGWTSFGDMAGKFGTAAP